MYSKTCPCCDRTSYSACPDREWICPYCFKDITETEVNEGGMGVTYPQPPFDCFNHAEEEKKG